MVSSQKPVKSHYISRCLTKPWEHGERMLSILDLDAEQLLRPTSSESAFAIDGLFSEPMERWFDRTFESPVSDWRARAMRGENPPVGWRLYRAMVLAILWSAPRVAAARRPSDAVAFDAALDKPLDDAALDQIAALYERDRVLVTAPTSPSAPLFFPSTAIFALLVPDASEPTGLGHAFFLPVHPNVALGLVPRGTDIEVLRDRWLRAGTLQNASAGHGAHCRRLVVAPAAVGLGEAHLLDAATKAQELTAGMFANQERARGLVDQMYALAGRPPPSPGPRRTR